MEKGHTEIVQLLHRCGANTSTVTEVSFLYPVNPLYTLYLCDVLQDEQTALMVAAAAGHTPIVEYFLKIDEMESEMKQSPDDIVSSLCIVGHTKFQLDHLVRIINVK